MYACLLPGYQYEVLFKKGSENIFDIISRLDYTNQLKPSDDSVAKYSVNIPKIDCFRPATKSASTKYFIRIGFVA